MAARAGRAGGRDATAPSARCDREFGPMGCYGISAEAIAKRAGATQPYLFRLLPGEKAIAAALTRSTEERPPGVREVAKDEGHERASRAMSSSMAIGYLRLVSAHPEIASHADAGMPGRGSRQAHQAAEALGGVRRERARARCRRR